jgi:hypothetical protein
MPVFPISTHAQAGRTCSSIVNKAMTDHTVQSPGARDGRRGPPILPAKLRRYVSYCQKGVSCSLPSSRPLLTLSTGPLFHCKAQAHVQGDVNGPDTQPIWKLLKESAEPAVKDIDWVGSCILAMRALTSVLPRTDLVEFLKVPCARRQSPVLPCEDYQSRVYLGQCQCLCSVLTYA